MKQSVTWVFLFFCVIVTRAQDNNSYQKFLATGSIPADFLGLSSDKYKQDRQQIDRSKKRKERKRQDRFYLESSFYVDRILHSGFVTFNDPVYVYINKVADKVLAHEPELRAKLRFYPIKFSSVNAFVVDRGIVFINIGLIARLDNEAQLAFIIDHEISHYIKKHNVNFYLESKKIEKKEGEYSKISDDKQIVASSHYSKAHELEADLEGFNMMRRTDYDPQEAVIALDKLMYAGQPLKDIPFSKTFLEAGYMQLPKILFADSVNAFVPDENEEDEESSHPAIGKRKEQIQKEFSREASNGSKPKFLVSQEDFLEVRRICRYEICRSLMLEGEYVDAIYHAYILLQDYPGDLFLKKVIAHSISKLNAFVQSGMKNEVLPALAHISGEQEQLYYLFTSFSKEEVAAVAFRYTWTLHKSNPEDDFLFELGKMNLSRLAQLQPDIKLYATASEFNDSIIDRYYLPKTSSKKSAKKVQSKTTRSKETVQKDETKQKVKKKVIRKRKPLKKQPFKTSFSRFVLADLKEDQQCMELFDSYAKLYKKTAKRVAEEEDDDDEEERVGARKRKQVKKNESSKILLDRMLLIEPDYLVIDQRKENPVNFLGAESKTSMLQQSLETAAEKAGVKLQIMSPEKFNESDVEQFNDYSIIKSWMDESYFHDTITLPATDRMEMKAISEKYNVRYIGWVRAISLINRRTFREWFNSMMYSIVFPPLAPFFIGSMITPNKDMAMIIVVFDSKENKVRYVDLSVVPVSDYSGLIKSRFYAFLKGVKKSK